MYIYYNVYLKFITLFTMNVNYLAIYNYQAKKLLHD